MDLARFIEHTRLKPNISRKEVLSACEQAQEYNFFGVCIPPYYVGVARKAIDEAKAETKVITVVGFPFGYARTSAKVEEVKQALRDGADEIDAVINIAAVKSGDFTAVENDINSMVTACQMQNKKAKLIFEVDLLNLKEINKLCMLAVETGADFVKTSTGMLPGGVTPEIVEKLRSQLPEKVLIKASGGIRTAKQVTALIEAGASRIGTSNGLKIIE
jgi:deoxyribose-phosphate aldolase